MRTDRIELIRRNRARAWRLVRRSSSLTGVNLASISRCVPQGRGTTMEERSTMRSGGSTVGWPRHDAPIAVLLLVAGCGRLGFDALAGADAGAGVDAGAVVDAPRTTTSSVCAAPYQALGGGCYRVATTPASWPVAEAACQADGAHLATIDDLAEQFTLQALSSAAGVSEIWIGYTDRVTEGTFRWVSPGGLDPSTDLCYFGPGGSNNTAANDCVVQESISVCGDWFVRDCALARLYVCERDGHAALATAF
jgi:hypothetical protein